MGFNNRVFLKIIELICAVACVALLESENITPPRPMLTCGAFVGFMIVGVALVITHSINAAFDKRIDMLLSIVGAVMFMAAGGIIIDTWHNAATPFGLGKDVKKYALSAGSISIINGVVYLVDCFLTFRS